MDDKPSPNENEFVKFIIIRTSDAARKEVTMPISSTKLVELKHKLAEDKYFGSKVAPVNRQRIFYLGRELKSNGRSLSNLGLGKYDNKILHLYIRPGKDEEEDDKDIKEVFSTDASPRKRRRTAGREQNISSTNRRDTINNNSLSSTVQSASTNPDNTIEILDSSDDDGDEVEIIEVL